VWVTDTSGNGTFLNNTRIAKGVPTKVDPGAVLAFVNPQGGHVLSYIVNGPGSPSPDGASTSKRRRVDDTTDVDASTASSAAAAAAALAGDVGEGASAASGTVDVTSSASTDAGGGAAASGATANDTSDAEAALLECVVCKEILHGVVTVLPCMHNFCGCCLTEWQSHGNNDCPSCRGPCTDVKRNHQ